MIFVAPDVIGVVGDSAKQGILGDAAAAAGGGAATAIPGTAGPDSSSAGSATSATPAADLIDLSGRMAGVRIPFRATKEIVGIVPHSGAAFVLVVEKEGIFERLLEDGFPAKHPCVLVTGKGFPDLPTRALVWQLHARFGLPVLGLADYNPYGAAIMLAFCDLPPADHGASTGRRAKSSAGASIGTKFTLPMRWLGMFDRDVEELPDCVLQEMTARDTSRAEGLLRDHGDLGGLCEEVQLMIDGGYKAELEALHSHGLAHLAETFLPGRIADVDGCVALER